MSKRCLVTGGAGFIGSHIVEALLGAGHEVAVLDDLSTGKRENLVEDVRIFELDITGDVAEAFREFRPEVVFHHAAQVSVSVSTREPELDARTNILGSIRVIQACRDHGVARVIYASSSAAYGPLETLPLREEQRPLPVSPYGISKHTVEHYLRSAGAANGLEWAALRYSNVYGPRQDPHGEAGVVAIFLERLLGGSAPTIFDDGELTRDYVFVTDVARANLAALEADLGGHPDPIFNIGTARETTVNRLFALLRETTGASVQAEYGPPRPGDVRRSALDPARARAELGWSPQIDLAEGLRQTTEFFRSRVG